MSDALSELNAFLKNISKQQQQQQVQAPSVAPRMQQNNELLQHPPGLPPLPLLPSHAKPLTEQELLLMYSSNQAAPRMPTNSASTLLSQIPLPNLEEFEFDFGDNQTSKAHECILEDELHKLSIHNRKPPPHAHRHYHTQQNTSLNESTNNDSNIIYSSNKYYMPGTASLIEDVDKQLMVILRDGKTLIGYLRSIDQYANLLLSNTIERIHVGNKYGDIPRGVYIIRGENVVLIGEVDFSKPVRIDMIKVDVDEILELKRIEEIKEQENEKNKKKALMNRCLLPQTDSILDDFY